MPASYSIDLHRGVVVTVLEGMVTLDEINALQAQVKVDEEFQPNLRSLVDLTRLTGFDFSSTDVRRILDASSLSSGSRRAIVGAPGIGYGLGRMIEILTDERGPQTRVFRDTDAALEWLTAVRPGADGTA
jgi:hypothetical protein